MNKIIKIEHYFYDDKTVIKESLVVHDRRDLYDVKFSESIYNFDYILKTLIGIPIKQFHVWANFLYVSETQYKENPEYWLKLVKDKE